MLLDILTPAQVTSNEELIRHFSKSSCCLLPSETQLHALFLSACLHSLTCLSTSSFVCLHQPPVCFVFLLSNLLQNSPHCYINPVDIRKMLDNSFMLTCVCTHVILWLTCACCLVFHKNFRDQSNVCV